VKTGAGEKVKGANRAAETETDCHANLAVGSTSPLNLLKAGEFPRIRVLLKSDLAHELEVKEIVRVNRRRGELRSPLLLLP